MELHEGKGLLVIGCGRMGGALVEGWIADGVPPAAIHVEEPYPSSRLVELAGGGVVLNGPRPASPAAVLLAVKPQMMAGVLASLASVPAAVPFISIAAGWTLAGYEAALGTRAIIRAMPNTPALVRRGITALVGNRTAQEADFLLARRLFDAVGRTVLLDDEAQMDTVTAVSGSGPAYLFLMTEALAGAGRRAGLSDELAASLSRATIAGAAALLDQSDRPASALREEVTSPGGTTAAALVVLMAEQGGMDDLLARAVEAARIRSVELAGSTR